MATFLKGEKNFYPEVKAFTPDYKFLSATLDARESKYMSGWEATNDVYSRVYSDLSRQDNKEIQSQFIDSLTPKLEKISGLDYSVARNVDAAKGVFAPFFEDDLIVKDIVYTSTYRDQLKFATQLENAADPEARELFNPIAIEAMQFRLKEFQEAGRNQALNMRLPKFVEDADLTQYAQTYLKERGLTATQDTFQGGGPGKDGIYGTDDDVAPNTHFIIKKKNGDLIEGRARNMIMNDLLDDPRVRQWYDTRAYVESMRFAEGAMKDGAVESRAQGVSIWAKQQLEVLQDINGKQTASTGNEINKRKSANVSWESYKESKGLLPAEKKLVEENKSTIEQLQDDLERRLGTKEFMEMPDNSDEASVSKAYAILANQYMIQDMNRGAFQYAYTDTEETMRENKFKLEEVKQGYELSKIRLKAYFTSKQSTQDFDEATLLADQDGGIKASLANQDFQNKLKLQLAEDESKGNDLKKNRQSSTYDPGRPGSQLFSINEDGEFKHDGFMNSNTNAIAKDEEAFIVEKADLIKEMLALRYPGQEKYSINIGTEDEPNMVEKNLDEIGILLNAKVKVYNKETQTEEDSDKFANIGLLETLFKDNANFFGTDNAKNVYKEHPSWVLGDDGVRNSGDEANTSYNKMVARLYGVDPQNPDQQGILTRESTFNKMVKRNSQTWYDAANNANSALTAETGGNVAYTEMVNAGYPVPYVIENGVKQFMTKADYVKKFTEMAISGSIQNFDVTGLGGDENSGDSNPDWMDNQLKMIPGLTTPILMNLPDMDAIQGKASFMYETLKQSANMYVGNTDVQTYLGLNRETSIPGSNIAFTTTERVTSTANPLPGTDAYRIQMQVLNQYKQSSKDPNQIVTVIQIPETVQDIKYIDVTKPDLTSESSKAANMLFQEAIVKGNEAASFFEIEYFQNYGEEQFDDMGNLISVPKAGYVIKNFDPAFITKLAEDDNTLTDDAINAAAKRGVMFVFKRDSDVSPGSFEKSSKGSYIKKEIMLSDNNVFKYTSPGDLFSPGAATFQQVSEGHINISLTRNVYNPLSTDPSNQFTVVNDSPIEIRYDAGENYSLDLTKKYEQVQNILKATERNNNAIMFQMRAKSLTEEKWKTEWKVKNPGLKPDAADVAYKTAMEQVNSMEQLQTK